MSEDKIEPKVPRVVVAAVGSAGTKVSPLTSAHIQHAMLQSLISIQKKSEGLWDDVLKLRAKMASASDAEKALLQEEDDKICAVIADMNGDDAKRMAVAKARYVTKNAQRRHEAEVLGIENNRDMTPNQKDSMVAVLMSGNRRSELADEAAKEFDEMHAKKDGDEAA